MKIDYTVAAPDNLADLCTAALDAASRMISGNTGIVCLTTSMKNDAEGVSERCSLLSRSNTLRYCGDPAQFRDEIEIAKNGHTRCMMPRLPVEAIPSVNLLDCRPFYVIAGAPTEGCISVSPCTSTGDTVIPLPSPTSLSIKDETIDRAVTRLADYIGHYADMLHDFKDVLLSGDIKIIQASNFENKRKEIRT